MHVNTQQIQTGLTNYIDNEIGKKAVGVNKFMVYFAMPIINKKVMEYVNNFATSPLTKEMFDENNNVDLDAVYNMAKSAVKRSGQFVMYGIVFDETDIDKLYSYIKGELY